MANSSAIGSLFIGKAIAEQQHLSEREAWHLGLVAALMPSPLAAALIVDGLARDERAEDKAKKHHHDTNAKKAELAARREELDLRRATLQSVGDLNALPPQQRERIEEDMVRLEEDARRLGEDERRLEEDIAAAEEAAKPPATTSTTPEPVTA